MGIPTLVRWHLCIKTVPMSLPCMNVKVWWMLFCKPSLDLVTYSRYWLRNPMDTGNNYKTWLSENTFKCMPIKVCGAILAFYQMASTKRSRCICYIDKIHMIDIKHHPNSQWHTEPRPTRWQLRIARIISKTEKNYFLQTYLSRYRRICSAANIKCNLWLLVVTVWYLINWKLLV